MAADVWQMTTLEDDFTYVLRKALTGNGLTPAEAADRAGVPDHDARALLAGTFSPDTARKFARVLGLKEEAFARHAHYLPEPPEVSGIVRLDLPMGGEQVNAWLVSEDGSCALFDAGYEARDLMEAIRSHRRRLPDRAFITHAHRDHTGALQQLLANGMPIHGTDIAGTIPIRPGDTVTCGPLTIRACDLSGHATPALGFHIGGLSRPVLVTGDALFAGSMGGCATPAIYQHALRRLREVLGPLPDDTVLLPGHGPASTLGQERLANPFL